MSKHKSAEQKLHVRTPYKTNSKKAFEDLNSQNQISPAPPKGTNANNQYR